MGLAHGRGTASPLAWRTLALVALALPLGCGLAGAIPALVPPAWQNTVLGVDYLLLGLLLGHGFARAAQQAQAWATPRLLLCGTLGAALCAGLLALGLHAWASLFAALLLLWALPVRATPSMKASDAS
ncbi:hypothetical protein D3C78_1213710 [compost metagenome]